jgi:hypothetical protein
MRFKFEEFLPLTKGFALCSNMMQNFVIIQLMVLFIQKGINHQDPRVVSVILRLIGDLGSIEAFFDILLSQNTNLLMKLIQPIYENQELEMIILDSSLKGLFNLISKPMPMKQLSWYLKPLTIN